jgi:hypothetical protein
MEARDFVKVRLDRVNVFLTHVSIDSMCDNLHCLCYMTVQLEFSHFLFFLLMSCHRDEEFQCYLR